MDRCKVRQTALLNCHGPHRMTLRATFSPRALSLTLAVHCGTSSPLQTQREPFCPLCYLVAGTCGCFIERDTLHCEVIVAHYISFFFFFKEALLYGHCNGLTFHFPSPNDRTKTHTSTRPSTRNRRLSWSCVCSSASCRVTNCNRKWLSNRPASRPRPHSLAQSPAAKSNPSGPPLPQRPPAPPQSPPRPMARQRRTPRSRLPAKTGEMCETRRVLHVVLSFLPSSGCWVHE